MPFKIIAIAAVACAILGFIAFKLMNKNKTKTFDPTMEVEKKRQSAEETLLESRYQSFLETHAEGGKVTLWVVHPEKCLEKFFKYGENLEKTQSYDDQRYHGFAKYKILLPESLISDFIDCIKSEPFKIVYAQDQFVPRGEIRILKK